MVVAAGIGAWLSTVADEAYLAQAALLTTSLAVVALSAALVLRRPAVIPAVIALLAAPYVAILVFETEALDSGAPALAGALYVVAELAYWSLELRSRIADEPGTYLRRAAVLAALALLAVALGTGLLVLVELVAARGTAVDVLGALAAIGAIALLVVASRHTGAKGRVRGQTPDRS